MTLSAANIEAPVNLPLISLNQAEATVHTLQAWELCLTLVLALPEVEKSCCCCSRWCLRYCTGILRHGGSACAHTTVISM